MNVRGNFIYNALLSVSQIILPIITFPYITRTLLPKSLGDVNFIDNIVQYVCIVAALGIPLYGTREVAKLRDNKYLLNKLFSELLTLHFCVSLICSIVFLLSLQFFEKLHTHFDLGLIGIGIILSNVFIINWLFSGLEKFAYITKISIIIRIISVIAIFLLIKDPRDKNLYYGITLVSNLSIGLINLAYSKRYISFNISDLRLKKHFKPLFVLFFLGVITNVYVLLDSVILGFLKDTVQVGYYAVAQRISKIPISLIASLTAVVIPFLTRNASEKEKMSAMIDKTILFTVIICIPIAIGLFCLAPELVKVFAGESFTPSIIALRILSFIIIPIGLALVSYQVLLPINKEKLIMNTAFIGLTISLGLNFLLIPSFNNIGCAVSSLITEFVVAGILMFFSKKYISYKIPWRIIIQCLILTIPFFLIKEISITLISSTISIVIFSVFASIIIYFSGLILIFKNEFVIENYLIVKKKFKRYF